MNLLCRGRLKLLVASLTAVVLLTWLYLLAGNLESESERARSPGRGGGAWSCRCFFTLSQSGAAEPMAGSIQSFNVSSMWSVFPLMGRHGDAKLAATTIHTHTHTQSALSVTLHYQQGLL